MQIKTRFAPSPTGLMHIGNFRTALFNYLIAKHLSGKFVLRIEDTDIERSSTTHLQSLCEDLRRMGLDWDEGPDPVTYQGYAQSERLDIYKQYFEQLIQNGKAYECYCSESELALSRKVQLGQGLPPRYSGTCRHLSLQEKQKKRAKGIVPTLRFYVDNAEVIQFQDLVKGQQRFLGSEIGDFIISKTDGMPTFMFANAVDDSLMGITHAVRGEDHLTNTPRQLMILQALQLPMPHYAHMPLILGMDGAPLSKRNGSQSIRSLLDQGFLPKAIINYLARLGHHLEHPEALDMQALGGHFAIENIGSAPARYDEHQLRHWQKLSLQGADLNTVQQWLSEAFFQKIPVVHQAVFFELVRDNVISRDEADFLYRMCFESIEYSDEAKHILSDVSADFYEKLKIAVDASGTDFNAISTALKTQTERKGKALFQPLRVIFTGSLHGPEMQKLLPLIGLEKMKERLQQAASLC